MILWNLKFDIFWETLYVEPVREQNERDKKVVLGGTYKASRKRRLIAKKGSSMYDARLLKYSVDILYYFTFLPLCVFSPLD